MKGICLTEHGPAIECGKPSFIPYSQRMLPDYVEGIRVYKGVESAILGHPNYLDIDDAHLKLYGFAIASIHTHMFLEKANKDSNTATYLSMLANPYVDILSRADNPSVPYDFEAMVKRRRSTGSASV